MTEWYYAKDGEKHGPVSTPQLKQLASAGHLQPDDQIWQEGMDGWAKASQAKGLFGGSEPPPLPLDSVLNAVDAVGLEDEIEHAQIRPPLCSSALSPSPSASADTSTGSDDDVICYPCKHCGTNLQKPKLYVGFKELCPACGLSHIVPNKATLRKAAPVDANSRSRSPIRTRASSTDQAGSRSMRAAKKIKTRDEYMYFS